MSGQNRKLAAILFADVVGYTSLMQKDESAASLWLKSFQNSINNKVKEYKGEVVNFYGDGALCTFNSPLDAMRCAIDLQSGFQDVDAVPVRIGIHSGTVVTEGDKVYGDSVNIAARIESMGIPGAILVSKKVRDELKNQPDILLPSLGSFEFKNVEEPMEVFALANEGFVVPKKEEMIGKFKTKSTHKKKWIWPLGIGLVFLACLIIWKSNSSSGLQLPDSLNIEPNTTIPKGIKDKRVAVMVFENQTMNPSLDAFGKMVSDWITKGLMETKKVNIISGANIQSKIQMAGVGVGSARRIAKETGVSVILEGRYYMQEENLIIHANIVDAEKGEVIHAFDPITGPKAQMIDLLDQLTQDAMGYWAIGQTERFLQNPPKYEAYQAYDEAEIIFYTEPNKAEELLKKAIELDSTFYIPMLKLMPLYGNMRRMDLYHEVAEILKPKQANFTEWEKLRFGSMIARDECDFEKAAEFAQRRFEMDPSDITASNNAASYFLFCNDPRQALNVLNDFDLKLRDMNISASNRELYMALSHFNLGEYVRVKEVIDSYPFDNISIAYALVYLEAMIRLGEFDKIDETKADFLNRNCFVQGGRNANDADLLLPICNDLLLTGQDSLAKVYGNQLEEWARRNSEDPFHDAWIAMSKYIQGEYQDAIGAISKIKNPFVDLISLKGICYARLNDRKNAEEQIEIINESTVTRGFTKGNKYYKMATVLTALGEHERAMDLLIQAHENCYPFRGNRYSRDHRLRSLIDNPRFQDLVKPKS